MTRTAGVVAVQGDVSEHAAAIERAAAAVGEDAGTRQASSEPSLPGDREDVEVREVREPGVVPDCDVLALPGGESTAISRLLAREGIDEEIRAHVAAGKPVLATCAGLIVASTDARDDRVDTLDLLDVGVERNAFGRQKDSFEASLPVAGLDEPFPAVFIRAPAVAEVGDDVEVLATVEGRPVAVREGPVVGLSFHPELTEDERLHRLALFESPAAATR